MDDKFFSFDRGISNNKVYARRGDIFICEGLFKEISDIEKGDHILGKPNRPVLIVSSDEHNSNIVKVLPFSTKPGSDCVNSISSGRLIRVPGINGNPNPNYIDITQIFTINVYQLKTKLGEASQEIVDTAVAIHTIQNLANDTSVDTMIKLLQNRFPNASIFNNVFKNEEDEIHSTVSYNPFEETYFPVKRVSYEELITEVKDNLKHPITKDDANNLYKEWLSLGTDMFRYKYGMTKQQYISLRDNCVKLMLDKVPNFIKYDWII